MNTTGERNDDGNGGDEIVAGEYVLGVMTAAQRRQAEARIADEPGFADRVRRWEADLSSLNADYEEIRPPRAVLAQIEGRLFTQSDRGATGASAGLWNSLVLWRALTLASLVVVAGMAAVVVSLSRSPTGAGNPLVAELSASKSPISLVAFYDRSSGRLRLTPVAAKADKPKSLELWMINGKNAPVALGLLPQSGSGDVVVPQDMRERFASGTVLAVSLEPEGGSPTGAPTGPVIASGPARSL